MLVHHPPFSEWGLTYKGIHPIRVPYEGGAAGAPKTARFYISPPFWKNPIPKIFFVKNQHIYISHYEMLHCILTTCDKFGLVNGESFSFRDELSRTYKQSVTSSTSSTPLFHFISKIKKNNIYYWR